MEVGFGEKDFDRDYPGKIRFHKKKGYVSPKNEQLIKRLRFSSLIV